MSPLLTIIADDLTGCLDTGVAFAARGWRTVLRFASKSSVEASSSGDVANDWRLTTDDPRLTTNDCLVWDTETREADEETARRVVRQVCAAPSVQATPRLYNKIDSTLRGPWLAELREVWKARAALTTVLCPAFPAVGRTVVDGEVRVHGRPLAETGFSGTGRLRELLLERWCGRVVSLDEPTARCPPGRSWPRAVAPPRGCRDGCRPGSPDPPSARPGPGPPPLRRGRPGRRLGPPPDPGPSLPPLEPIAGPIWVLAGSQHPATHAQMETLPRMPGVHVHWFSAEDHEAARRLSDLPDAAVTCLALTAGSEGLSPSFRDWATDFITAAGKAARERGVAAFAATGGETAALLLRALGVGELKIDRELLPGIPLCRMADGICAGTPLITKAGGFGEPDALVQAITVVRSGPSGF